MDSSRDKIYLKHGESKSSKIQSLRTKIKMEVVPEQQYERSSARRSKFVEPEDDGFPLDSILNFFAVKMVLEINDIPYKDMDTILVDTLMKLQNSGKKEFDVFQTKVIFLG